MYYGEAQQEGSHPGQEYLNTSTQCKGLQKAPTPKRSHASGDRGDDSCKQTIGQFQLTIGANASRSRAFALYACPSLQKNRIGAHESFLCHSSILLHVHIYMYVHPPGACFRSTLDFHWIEARCIDDGNSCLKSTTSLSNIGFQSCLGTHSR